MEEKELKGGGGNWKDGAGIRDLGECEICEEVGILLIQGESGNMRTGCGKEGIERKR